MRIPKMSLINRSNRLMVAALVCFFSTNGYAEPQAADTAAAAITRNQADAILQELKEIRKVLEKIEKKSPAQAAKRQRPTSATVNLEKDRPAMGADDAPLTVVELSLIHI